MSNRKVGSLKQKRRRESYKDLPEELIEKKEINNMDEYFIELRRAIDWIERETSCDDCPLDSPNTDGLAIALLAIESEIEKLKRRKENEYRKYNQKLERIYRETLL